MTTHPHETPFSSIIVRDLKSSRIDYLHEIREAVASASYRRQSSKIVFDFDEENGFFETGRKTKKCTNSIDDMAFALHFGNCKSVHVFPNALGSVTVKCD